ncbi:MAG: ThiF family adenylyltransferase, partial [Pseudomonadota bacterium]
MTEMSDNELLRYNRHIMMPELDITGQQRLRDAHALVMGLGGLGSPVALYLAAAGLGELTLVDFDAVDLSNLQRQIAHGTHDIGTLKVTSAKASIEVINPLIKVNEISSELDVA